MKISHTTRYAALTTLGIIILVILAAFMGLTMKQDDMIKNYVHLTAQTYFDSILITRRWNANYGGVYVQKNEGVKSNPYLVKPDITTREGVTYTMKNPALMTRELSELAGQSKAFQYHITSLKLLNPSNAPDPWEREALLKFESGIEEVAQVTELNNRKMYRLMRPLPYEQGCVECHAKQGYKIGDVRGGISVALPYDDIETALIGNRLKMMGLALAIILALTATFYLLIWKLLKRLSQTTDMLEAEKNKLEASQAELARQRDTLDDIVSAIDADLLLLNRDMRILWVNKKLKERDPYLCGEIVGQLCNKAYCNIEHVPENCPAALAFSKSVPIRQEHPITHPDGITRFYHFTCSPIRGRDNHVTHVLELVQDITEKKAAADLLKQKAKEIEDANSNLKSEVVEREKVEEALRQSASDLEKKNAELERMNRLFVGRELRMAELKERIEELEKKIESKGKDQG